MWQQQLELGQDIRWHGAGVLPWVEVLSLGSPSETGPGSAEGGNNAEGDRKSTRLNSSHSGESRMPSSA